MNNGTPRGNGNLFQKFGPRNNVKRLLRACFNILKNVHQTPVSFRRFHWIQSSFTVHACPQKDDCFVVQQRGYHPRRVDRVPNYGLLITMSNLNDVRAHCHCASLVPTLYMTWRVPRHVFQACAPSRNSTKYRADELCCNLISEYFCWMLGDPHFFSADHFLF